MGPDGAFITGSDVLVDGGVTAAYWFGERAPRLYYQTVDDSGNARRHWPLYGDDAFLERFASHGRLEFG